MDDSLRRSGATGWTTFIPANFLAGILAIWVYTGLRSSYGPGPKTAIRTALTVWVVFWVIPEAALLPLNRFPRSIPLLIGEAERPTSSARTPRSVTSTGEAERVLVGLMY